MPDNSEEEEAPENVQKRLSLILELTWLVRILCKKKENVKVQPSEG
jgi:hypothetical protein